MFIVIMPNINNFWNWVTDFLNRMLCKRENRPEYREDEIEYHQLSDFGI